MDGECPDCGCEDGRQQGEICGGCHGNGCRVCRGRGEVGCSCRCHRGDHLDVDPPEAPDYSDDPLTLAWHERGTEMNRK